MFVENASCVTLCSALILRQMQTTKDLHLYVTGRVAILKGSSPFMVDFSVLIFVCVQEMIVEKAVYVLFK